MCRGVLSRGGLSRGGLSRGVLSRGFCLGGFCPRITVMYVSRSLLQHNHAHRATVSDVYYNTVLRMLPTLLYTLLHCYIDVL